MSSLSPTPALQTTRTLGATRGAARCIVAGTLNRYAHRQRVDPLLLRHLFASAFRATILAGWPANMAPPQDVLLGLQSGRRTVVPLCGLRLHVPLSSTTPACPYAASLFYRGPEGLVPMAERAFGHPDNLRAAARVQGLPSELGVEAIRRITLALARAAEPDSILAAQYRDDIAGWEAYRVVEVVRFVRDPRVQIELHRARALDRRCNPGDLLGVGLPIHDWLTPVLRWMRGGG
ncbi:MAG: hypothetical protein EA397_17755 [Deltaproteobacteria bacterium]|nr:MAG: hypothetical protein EA397_17755 [Deltaproteobacteria bacterium]